MYKITSLAQTMFMKKMKKILMVVCLSCAFLLAGCNEKELPSATIVRDDARTGGSISFVYDKHTRTVTVGGQDEIIQYSSDEISPGTRVGLKVTAPDENIDLSSAKLEMNDQNYTNFMEKINDTPQRFFVIYPTLSEKDNNVSFTVTWADNTKPQTYKITVAPGTKFMSQNGEVK